MDFLNNEDSEEKGKSFLPLTKCDAQAPTFGKNGGNGCANENVIYIIAREFSISNIWAHALFFARCGFKVFPLLERSKRPLIKEWPEKATNYEAIILQWAATYPENNFALLTGTGWFVLDFDPRGATGGEQDGAADEVGYEPLNIGEELQRVQAKLGWFEPGTLVKTGRGFQLYCSADGFDIRNDHEKRLTDKVDVKGSGGYVVGPGSIHPNGRQYEFVDLHTLEDGIKLTKLLPAALQYIVSLQGGRRTIGADDETCVRKASNQKSKVPGNALDYVKPIAVGARNDTLFKIACHYREVNGLQANDIYRILRDIIQTDCEKPLDDSELMSIVASSCKYPAGRPRTEIEEQQSQESFSEDVLDLFQANRLIELFRLNVQKFHVGDENVTELLMLSVASMSVKNTNGLQPKLSGDSGMGKTHSTKTVLHLMHPTIYVTASFSSKALFYDKETLRPKMVIFSDDVNLAPDVEETVRAAMTNWDSPTERITLDGKRNPITLSVPPRIVFGLLASAPNRRFSF